MAFEPFIVFFELHTIGRIPLTFHGPVDLSTFCTFELHFFSGAFLCHRYSPIKVASMPNLAKKNKLNHREKKKQKYILTTEVTEITEKKEKFSWTGKMRYFRCVSHLTAFSKGALLILKNSSWFSVTSVVKKTI